MWFPDTSHIFSQPGDCFFILLIGSFTEHKFLILPMFNLSCFPMMNHTFGEKFRSLCLALDPEDLLCVFYNSGFYLENCLLNSSQLKSVVLIPRFKTLNEYMDELAIAYIAGIFKKYI